jgi:hypothetical protein
MTPEETKKCIEVMQAYVDGKEIQTLNCAAHHKFNEPEWDWEYFDYCVIDEPLEKEPKPFDWRGKNIQWVRFGSGFPEGIFRVLQISNEGVKHSAGFCGWPLIKNLEWSEDNATWRRFE